MPGFVSPSTGCAVRAVLFDTFGTVVDWRTGISRAVQEFADRHRIGIDATDFATRWRARYQPAMHRVRTGARPYVTLDILHRENLDEVLSQYGLTVAAFADEELDTLARAWRELPPWPDSVAGIAALKRHYIVGPLSNANTSLLVDMAKLSGLGWDVVLGTDVSRAYKPDPAAYLAPVALLGLDPGEVMLAAAHNDDLAAARNTGLATAFIARPGEHGPGQTRDLTPESDWDASASSITELAGTLTPPQVP